MLVIAKTATRRLPRMTDTGWDLDRPQAGDDYQRRLVAKLGAAGLDTGRFHGPNPYPAKSFIGAQWELGRALVDVGYAAKRALPAWLRFRLP